MTLRDLLPEIRLPAEAAQKALEGCDVAGIAARIAAAQADGVLADREEDFWRALDALPTPAPSVEPRSFSAIRAARPPGARRAPPALDHPSLLDRIYGAWLGRCAGCTLGKPVEGWSRDRVAAYLRAAGAYPLASYIPVLDPFPPGLALGWSYPGTTLGNITRMVRDDDIDYTVLALRTLEEHGRGFSAEDVAAEWLDNLPFGKVYTAEAVAYHNLVIGLKPPATARYRNPYREWIGAQIRADMWGYVNPGDPEAAAEMAYRDAVLSHTGNGIYGAMWSAACIAASLATPAFAAPGPEAIVEAGLGQIPDGCRLAEAIRSAVGWYHDSEGWEDAAGKVIAASAGYDPVHVVNNTCMIVLALLYGAGDLGRTISYAVMGGWDTDCTGATAGSIAGAALGARALPQEWIAPLHDQLESLVPGFAAARIGDLAGRTMAFVRLPDEGGHGV